MLGGERVAIDAEIDEEIRFEAQDIPLDIVYEDDDILVINNHAIWWYILARVTRTVRY